MLLAEFKRPVAAEKTKVEVKSNRCSARGGVALGPAQWQPSAADLPPPESEAV
jgi:hypothetical protein